MNKHELIEAIEATLVPNGNKAITADALRNLLIDIVENSGGGGQGGGITLQLSMEIDETGSTPTVTPEQIAHNKEQMDILKQLHDEGKPIPPIAIEMIDNIDGMMMSEILMYMIIIMWDITGTEVPEGMPEGLIFPVVKFMDIITINGDGTLIEM